MAFISKEKLFELQKSAPDRGELVQGLVDRGHTIEGYDAAQKSGYNAGAEMNADSFYKPSPDGVRVRDVVRESGIMNSVKTLGDGLASSFNASTVAKSNNENSSVLVDQINKYRQLKQKYQKEGKDTAAVDKAINKTNAMLQTGRGQTKVSEVSPVIEASNNQIRGAAAQTGLDVLSAGTYGSAAKGLQAGKLGSAGAPTALATLSGRSAMKAVGTGAGLGYGYDVAGSAQRDETGNDTSFSPGLGTVLGGAIPGAMHAGGLYKAGASRAGVFADSSTADAVFANPERFSKQGIADLAAPEMAYKVGKDIGATIEQLSSTGKQYDAIKAQNHRVFFGTAKKAETLTTKVAPILKEMGYGINAEGALYTMNTRVPVYLRAGELAEVQKFVNQYGQRSDMSVTDFLNTRNAIRQISSLEPMKTDNLTGFRKAVENLVDSHKTQIPGLKQLDDVYGPAAQRVHKLQKDYMRFDPTTNEWDFKNPEALKKLAREVNNPYNKEMNFLEEQTPGFKSEIQLMAAAKDLVESQARFHNKVLPTAATGVAAGSLYLGGLPLIPAITILGAFNRPTVMAALRNTGRLSKFLESSKDTILNKLESKQALNPKEMDAVMGVWKQRVEEIKGTIKRAVADERSSTARNEIAVIARKSEPERAAYFDKNPEKLSELRKKGLINQYGNISNKGREILGSKVNGIGAAPAAIPLLGGEGEMEVPAVQDNNLDMSKAINSIGTDGFMGKRRDAYVKKYGAHAKMSDGTDFKFAQGDEPELVPQVLFAEAGNSEQEVRDILSVILNRAKSKENFNEKGAKTLSNIVKADKQFQAYGDKDNKQMTNFMKDKLDSTSEAKRAMVKKVYQELLDGTFKVTRPETYYLHDKSGKIHFNKDNDMHDASKKSLRALSLLK
jgi:Cell Wall Hydrolase